MDDRDPEQLLAAVAPNRRLLKPSFFERHPQSLRWAALSALVVIVALALRL